MLAEGLRSDGTAFCIGKQQNPVKHCENSVYLDEVLL